MVATRRSDKKTAYKVGSKVEILTSDGISIGVLIKKLALGSILDHQQHNSQQPNTVSRRNRGGHVPASVHATAKKGEAVDHWLVRLEGQDDPSPYSEHAFGKSVDDDYPLPGSVEISESETSSINSGSITTPASKEPVVVSTEPTPQPQSQTTTTTNVITPPTDTLTPPNESSSSQPAIVTRHTRRSLPTAAAKAETRSISSLIHQSAKQPKQRPVRRSLSPKPAATAAAEKAAAATPVKAEPEQNTKKRRASPEPTIAEKVDATALTIQTESDAEKQVVETKKPERDTRRTRSSPEPAAVETTVEKTAEAALTLKTESDAEKQVDKRKRHPAVPERDTKKRRASPEPTTAPPAPKRVSARVSLEGVERSNQELEEIDSQKRNASPEPTSTAAPHRVSPTSAPPAVPKRVSLEVAESSTSSNNNKEVKTGIVETKQKRTLPAPSKRGAAPARKTQPHGKHAKPAAAPKVKPPARVNTRSSGQVLYTATDDVDTLLKQRKTQKKDATTTTTTTTTTTKKQGETVIKIPMLTGILYLYRGKRRSAKFVPLK